MSLRSRVEATFGAQACGDAPFFAMPIALRFALANDGDVSSTQRAATAMRNGLRICGEIFDSQESLVVCLRAPVVGGLSVLAPVRSNLQSHRGSLGGTAEVWLQNFGSGEDSEVWELQAFEAPAARIPELLWHAITVDMGDLRSGPSAGVYLFNISKGIAAHPYDDRGMDVFGPNRSDLKDLGGRHAVLLLEAKVEDLQ